MIVVLHVIQTLSSGGAARAMLSSARYTLEHGDYCHQVLSLKPPDSSSLIIAEQLGIEVLYFEEHAQRLDAIAKADIVQVEWWNDPHLSDFLRGQLGLCRLVTWLHVFGRRDPQYITPEVIKFSDVAVATSPACYESPSIMMLDPEVRQRRTAMIYGCADFEGFDDIHRTNSDTFNVGYVGTVNYTKMHPDFIRMSCDVKIDGVKFIVCGGDQHHQIANQAGANSNKFDFRGFVDNIPAVLSEFDVYGYPLCEDTYASSELNLQEVMYAGIPPVVFPYGGVGKLVVNEFTGIVVHTEWEYSRAIEFLYHNPIERYRIGKNAKEYAQQLFGARNAARKFHQLYQNVMKLPKRNRAWGVDHEIPIEQQKLARVYLEADYSGFGSDRFIDSLGEERFIEAYTLSKNVADVERALEIEDSHLISVSPLMEVVGLAHYAGFFSSDSWLRYWYGLACMGCGKLGIAVHTFSSLADEMLPDWRSLWRLSQCHKMAGESDAFLKCIERLKTQAPDSMSTRFR